MVQMAVRNLEINDRTVPNAFVITGDGKTTLQSYKSTVCVVYRENSQRVVVLGSRWNYSNTTRRHLYAFLEQEAFGKLNGKEVQKRIDNGTFHYDENM